MTKDSIQAILDERGKRYGSFKDNARISSKLYAVIHAEYLAQPVGVNANAGLQPHHIEALKMICHKIARIVSGDPNYVDNWDDIAGYAQLGKEPR